MSWLGSMCCVCAHAGITITNRIRGSAKKPLTVIIFLVIIAMCLSMADGAPRYKRRHASSCHHRLETPDHRNRTKLRHGREANLKPRRFAVRLHRIQRRLTNTLAKFSEVKHNPLGTRRQARGMAEWLPKVKFVDIVKNNSGSAVKRFELLVPKLHRNMKHFQAVFDCLQMANATFDSSDPEDRTIAIKSHQDALVHLVTEVEDSMAMFNRCIPVVNSKCDPEAMSKLGLHLNVSQSVQMEQDALAYRAYTRTLKNWKLAFRCGLPSQKDKLFCKIFRQQIEKKNSIR